VSDTQPDNPPAFPVPAVAQSQYATMPGRPGMTLRDWYAGRALGAYLSAPGSAGDQARDNYNLAAIWSYEMADAMLRAREGKP
jgi:hypothetical protein